MIFSNNVKVTNFNIKSVEPMYSNQSWTGQRLIRSTGIQYYQIEFNLNFNMDKRQEVMAFIAEYSQGKPFTFSLGHLSTYSGNQVGALTASGQANKGQISVNTSTNNLQVGELIQFTNHSKIYRVIARAANNITVFPALQNVVLANEPIQYNNLMITAVLNPDNDYTLPISVVSSMKFGAMEYIV